MQYKGQKNGKSTSFIDISFIHLPGKLASIAEVLLNNFEPIIGSLTNGIHKRLAESEQDIGERVNISCHNGT